MAANDDEKKALNRAVEIIKSAEGAIQPRFQERQFYSNMYHTFDEVLKYKQWWQTKFAHALPFFTIETKASFLYEGVFGQSSKGIWQVNPSDINLSRAAEVTTKLLKYQEEKSDFVRTFYTGAKCLNIYGDWFLETYWDRQEKFIQQRPRNILAMDGNRNPVIQRKTGAKIPIVKKNQPDVRTLYINSVWPDPKATSIQNARFICVRREMTLDELKQGEQNGKYINVELVKNTKMPKVPSNYYDVEPYSPYVKSGNSQKMGFQNPVDSENPLIEVIDIIYPAIGEVESIANREVYLGTTIRYNNIQNPIVHIKNYEELGKFFGTSDLRAIAPMWRIINQYQYLEADNMLMHHRGYTKVQRDAGPDVVEAYENLAPGDVITMNNIGGAAHDRPDLFAPLAYQVKQGLIQEAQQPMGMNEILQGATPSSNVRSTGQFAQLANFGAKMLSQSIRNIADGLKQVGENWLLLDYEMLDTDQIIPITGPDGQFIDQLRASPDDIDPEAIIGVKLSADLEAQKAQKVQQFMQAINMASAQVPGFAGSKAIKDLFRTWDFTDNPDQYFLLSDEESAALRTAQFRQEAAPAQEPALAGSTVVADPNQLAVGNANSGNPTLPGV